MQQANNAWISLFRRVPVELHEFLVLGLTTGSEIVMQRIVRTDPDFMIIRGRVSGTQDTGRIIMVPYEQMTYVALTRILRDEEIESVFGRGAPVVALDLPPMAAIEPRDTPPMAPAPEAVPIEANTLNPPAGEVNPPKKPDPASKSILLAKLRERLKETK